MLLHFTIYNTRHNSPKRYEVYHGKYHFSISMGSQCATENECHGFGNLQTFWKRCGNCFKGVCSSVEITTLLGGKDFLHAECIPCSQ